MRLRILLALLFVNIFSMDISAQSKKVLSYRDSTISLANGDTILILLQDVKYLKVNTTNEELVVDKYMFETTTNKSLEYISIYSNDNKLFLDSKREKIFTNVTEGNFMIVKSNNDIYKINYKLQTNPSALGDSIKKCYVNTIPIISKIDEGDNIFNDSKAINSENIDPYTVQRILKKYNINPNDLEKHLFLNQLDIGRPLTDKERPYLSNIAKTDVTNFASGMAKFLVERAKEEMTDMFFSKMYDHLIEIPEMQLYFQNSIYYLENVKKERMAIDYEVMRHNFQSDIDQLPYGLYAHLNSMASKNNSTIKEFFNKPEGLWMQLALNTAIQSYGQLNPKDILYNFVWKDLETREKLESNLEFLYKEGKDLDNIKGQLNLLNSLKLAELVSSSLLSSDPSRYWVEESEIEKLFHNEALFKTYIGLLLAKSDFADYNIRFYGDSGDNSLKNFIENRFKEKMNLADLQPLVALVKDCYIVYKNVERMSAEIRAFEGKQGGEQLMKNAVNIFSILKDNLTHIAQHLEYQNLVGFPLKVDRKQLFDVIVPAIDLVQHVRVKNYTLAINSAMIIMRQVKGIDEKIEDVYSKFAKYGTLVAKVSQAQSSSEVQQAIQSAVLPVGSSRIKRYSNFSVTLNAYVGLVGGYAWFKNYNPDTDKLQRANSWTAAVYAPIGIGVNCGNLFRRQPEKKQFGIGFNFQLIDLGGLVNFYFKNGTGLELPNTTKITFGDILAPGASLSISFGDTPVSAIIGWQYVNNLSRTIAGAADERFKPMGSRVHLGIVVDIPLFNLYIKN